MRLQFVGSGDAFGSGGRFNTCLHVTGQTVNFLIDFGASSLVALKQRGIDRSAVKQILFTHFHGDHFGGIPFFILDAELLARRTGALTLAGPPGLSTRYAQVMDTAFPSFPHQPSGFQLRLAELTTEAPVTIGDLRVTAFPVVHAEAAGPCLGLRIEAEGKVVAYSGDTEWTESLIDIGKNADLFVCECFTFEHQVYSHNNYMMLKNNMSRIGPKRLILTHMSEDMLARAGESEWETASDGMIVEF